jgi:integrase
MATVKFNLRAPSAAKAQPINLIFRHQKLKVTYPTGFKVLPEFWSKDRQRVRNVGDVPERDRINNALNQLRTEVDKWAVMTLEARATITKDELKRHLDDFTGRRPGPGKNLFTYFQRWVDDAENRILPSTGRPPQIATIKQHRTTLQTLRAFGADYRRPVDFGTVDVQFYDDFVKWMRDRDAKTNTIGKHIKVLKTVLNAAVEDGVNNYLTFRGKHFRVLKEDVHTIYLNVSELAAIAKLDLTASPRLDRVRDLFLLGAWTGLRFSDFTNLSPDNIRGGNIYVNQRKTGGAVTIPVLPIVAQIMEKYGGGFPAAISNQKTNAYLKEIGEMAGIDDPILKRESQGGKKVTRTVRKYDLIGTHTARRSYATNSYLRGIGTVSIMAITGHKTETAFLKYIKVDKEQHADIVRKGWESAAVPHIKAV